MIDLLVDGNSLFARSWFAVSEQPEEAERVFISQVLQLLDPVNGRLGDYISRTMFAWDGKAKTEKNRDEKPKEYKATRRRVQEVLLTLFNTVHGYHPEFEADDVVATAAFNSTARQVFVVSGDKDLMQLQGGNVAYYCLNQKCLMSSMAICKKFKGIKKPLQSAIALAILGDKADGIPGVYKWGPKKLEKVFEAVAEGMNFESAFETVKRQVPDELMEDFLYSIDKTLLHTDLEGIPEPEPLKFCNTRDVLRLGIDRIVEQYERVADLYDDAGPEAMLTGSGAGSRRQNRG